MMAAVWKHFGTHEFDGPAKQLERKSYLFKFTDHLRQLQVKLRLLAA